MIRSVMSDQIATRIKCEYRGTEVGAARAMVARVGSELSIWREVSSSDRIERAALTYAGGDLARLREAVDLALRDWRDLLVAVGDA
jgi:hypothetical protein